MINGASAAGRKIYIGGGAVSLAEYLPETDARKCYDSWFDPEVQSGYNFVRKDTFEEYAKKGCVEVAGQRFHAVIISNGTREVIGAIGLSPEGTPPDLSIRIFKPHCGRGYGAEAFALGVKYCFDALNFDRIYAGCYPHNKASRRMLEKCGFRRNPAGDLDEKHYLTGEPIVQYDYVTENPMGR